MLHGEETLCNVLAGLWIANQTKQPGQSNVNLESRTLRRVSPPGVVASSLSTASRRARTSSIGVRGRVRKKFMASEARRVQGEYQVSTGRPALTLNLGLPPNIQSNIDPSIRWICLPVAQCPKQESPYRAISPLQLPGLAGWPRRDELNQRYC
jgi:hypothetical protein